MPFLGSVSGSRSGRIFSLGGKPGKVAAALLTAGNFDDTFSWSAPQNNGIQITKYGYQTSTNNGLTWSSEIETTSLSVVLNTKWSTSSYKIRVRAYNAAGWGEYSDISVGTAAWTSVTGTETETDTVCGPAGCVETETENCDCGTRSRTRTRTSSRTRTRSTQQYTRSGSTSSSITYGSWSDWSGYTYSEWGAYGAWSSCSGTRTRVETEVTINGTTYYPITHQDGTIYHDVSGDSCSDGVEEMWDITLCLGVYRVVYLGCQPFWSIK